MPVRRPEGSQRLFPPRAIEPVERTAIPSCTPLKRCLDYLTICAFTHILSPEGTLSIPGRNATVRDLVKAFKALSDETRLRILNLLLERECCVCEVMQALDISQTRASRNLSALYDAGFLKLRKDGLWSLYSIDAEGMKEHLGDVVEAVRKGLGGREVATLDRERLRKAVRVGPGCGSRGVTVKD